MYNCKVFAQAIYYVLMVINVTKNKVILFNLDKAVFELLFDHTIVRRKTKYLTAIDAKSINFEDFIKLSQTGEVPYPLFFLEITEVKKIIAAYEKAIYFGVSKNQMSIASRGEIKLADISLVLKDITRKQNFLKKYIDHNNTIPGTFKRNKKTVEQHAANMRELLGYNLDAVEVINKEKSFDLFSSGLAKHNVFISLYAHNFTPQTINKDLQFSGIAVYDRKCPFLFIKAGDNNSKIELWGRRLFTAALLLSCLCSSDCGPLTMDGKSGDLVNDKHYIFAEEFLMPSALLSKEGVASLQDIKDISDKYSVSTSAIVMRLYRLGTLSKEVKDSYLVNLNAEWDKITSDSRGGRQLAPAKAINRYNNPTVVKIIVEKYHLGIINEASAKNLLCYKKGETFSLEGL